MGGEKFDTPHPEGYLFGENMDLNFLGSRPVQVGLGGLGTWVAWRGCQLPAGTGSPPRGTEVPSRRVREAWAEGGSLGTEQSSLNLACPVSGFHPRPHG